MWCHHDYFVIEPGANKETGYALKLDCFRIRESQKYNHLAASGPILDRFLEQKDTIITICISLITDFIDARTSSQGPLLLTDIKWG